MEKQKTKIHLATCWSRRPMVCSEEMFKDPLYVLETYWQLKQDTPKVREFLDWTDTAKSFILDSGAFTFINAQRNGKLTGKLAELDMYDYAERYANFVKKHNIDQFIELDVDSIDGYEKVLEYREIIEGITGKKSIPVWHDNRGEKGWKDMVSQYEFVAIGGITSSNFRHEMFPYIIDMCKYAHSNGVKVHGLGFMDLDHLNNWTIPFDSCDATSWLGIQGQLYTVNEKEEMTKKKASRDTHWRIITRHNWKEWQKYCEIHGR